MPDIFLYPGAANPNDIVLRDPTQSEGGGTVYTQNVAGVLATAGELAKATTRPLAGTLATSGELAKATRKGACRNGIVFRFADDTEDFAAGATHSESKWRRRRPICRRW